MIKTPSPRLQQQFELVEDFKKRLVRLRPLKIHARKTKASRRLMEAQTTLLIRIPKRHEDLVVIGVRVDGSEIGRVVVVIVVVEVVRVPVVVEGVLVEEERLHVHVLDVVGDAAEVEFVRHVVEVKLVKRLIPVPVVRIGVGVAFRSRRNSVSDSAAGRHLEETFFFRCQLKR